MLDDLVTQTLQRLEAEGLLRVPNNGLKERAERAAVRTGRRLLDACSNDYLGVARSDVSRETSEQFRAPWGAGASRLIHGTHVQHLELESELAGWVGLEAALFFSSGYAANVGLLQALGSPETVVVSDELNHASIIDGCRLSRSRIEIVPHRSLEGVKRALDAHRDARLCLVATESYFSMDGDAPDLPALRALCDRFGAALLVDEAHALGVFGAEGAGRCRAAGVAPDALVGTLGKGIGVQGAFVAGTARLRDLLWNRARSFVFSTAPSPRLAEAIRFHVQHVRRLDDLRGSLAERSDALRAALRERGVEPLRQSFGPIVPVVVGDERRLLPVTEALADAGILVQGIRPPTVPPGTARLRLTVKATWDGEDVERLAHALARAVGRP